MSDAEKRFPFSLTFLVGLRDLCNQEIQKQKPPELKEIPESIFTTLKYEERNSDKLKIFEVADRANNNPKAFDEALKDLQERKATISERLRIKGYHFEFWSWEDRIFRKKLS